jgi:hypothetical protein
MKATQQLNLFGQQCWGEADLVWQVLERDERAMDTDRVLEYIEGYTGKLQAETILIPVQVLYVPGTNFFLMPVLEESEDDEN